MRNAKATAAVTAAAVCIFAAAAGVPGFPARQSPASQGQQRISAAKIVLPPQLETEKPATLAVLDGQGRLLSGAAVDLPEGRRVTTDSTGRARFVVTSAPGQFTVQTSVGSPAIGKVTETAEVVSDPPASSIEINISKVQLFAELGGRITVWGDGFRGDADMNKVFIGGRPALVLAASPVSLVAISPPGVGPGIVAMLIQVAGKTSAPASSTIVSLSVEPQAIPIVEGKKNHLILSVRGTDQRLMLSVENQTPDAIELTGGNVQRVRSSGGARNHAVIEMRALRPKDFSVAVKLAAEGP